MLNIAYIELRNPDPDRNRDLWPLNWILARRLLMPWATFTTTWKGLDFVNHKRLSF